MRVTQLLLALVAVLTVAIPSVAETYAIIVGVSDYRNDEDIRDLQYSTVQARQLRDLLIQLGAATSVNITLLTDSAATKAAIQGAFQRVASLDRPTDTVIFYFSGHGGSFPDRDGDESDSQDEYICPYETSRTDMSTRLTDDEFGMLVNQLESRSVAIFIDACHSGGIAKGYSPMNSGVPGDGTFAKDVFTSPNARPGRVMMSACNSEEFAYEVPDLEGSVFSVYLLEGIQNRRADANGDRKVTFDELAAYVKASTADACWKYNLCMTPQIENPDLREIVIIPRPAQPTPPPASPDPSPPANTPSADVVRPTLPTYPRAKITSVKVSHLVDTSGGNETRRVYFDYVADVELVYAFISGAGYQNKRVSIYHGWLDPTYDSENPYHVFFPDPPEIPDGASEVKLTLMLADANQNVHGGFIVTLPVGKSSVRRNPVLLPGILLLLVLVVIAFSQY